MRNDDLRLTISTGKDRKEEDHWQTRHTTWGKLVQRLSKVEYTGETSEEYRNFDHDRKQDTKDVGGFVGGELRNGSRKIENVISRCVLALDIDFGAEDTWDAYEMLCDWECLMHTTHSHTREKPRYRLFFPLARPVTKEEYEPMARMVAKQIDMELFDDTTYEANRLMFWPSCPKDGEFIVKRHEGKLIDPDEILGYYNNWRDRAEWPSSTRTKVAIKTNLAKLDDPRKKGGAIGAFNRVYDIPTAIEVFLPDVYEAWDRDETRYTYTKGTSAHGLKLYGPPEDPLHPPYVFAYSHHDTDPCSRKCCSAFDLVRIHKFPNDDESESLRDMLEFVKEDADVRADFLRESEKLTKQAFAANGTDDNLAREKDDWNELGNAILLKDSCKAVLRYNASTDWCYWDGCVWRQNAECEAMMLAMAQTDKMRDDALYRLQIAPQPKDKNRPSTWPEEYARAMNALKWANSSRGYTRLSNTLKNARTLLKIDDPDKFDKDEWLLNTPGGMVNLRTGEMLEHDAKEMCTMITTVTPAPNKPSPMWDAFLDRVTGGDKDFQRYLQEVAGMALVGKVYEEGLVIVYGPGSNGKSTLFSVWQMLMGEYAGTVRNEVLMGTRFGGEVAGQNLLRGKRLVITSELEESQVMQNSLLKRLTSRDKISANVKFHEPITFTPSHTLVLHTNHLPRLRSVDGGTVRRIAVCPFNAVISGGERVADFAGVLVEKEGPQILSWMIEGAKRFYTQEMTLKKPKVVEDATREYIEGEDVINQFMEECCVREDGAEESVPKIRDCFYRWGKKNAPYAAAVKPRAFYTELEKRGVRMRTGKARVSYTIGFRLREEAHDEYFKDYSDL